MGMRMGKHHLHGDTVRVALISVAALMIVAAGVIGVLVYSTASATASLGITDDLRILTTHDTRSPMVKVSLAEPQTVMQSFAFSADGAYLYATQVTGSRSASARTRHLVDGNLTVTKIRMADGKAIASMRLQGFGHGESVGVETRDSGDYLWTEVDSMYGAGGKGWGTRIARVRWVDNATVSAASDAVERFDCPPDAALASNCTPALDASADRIAIRYLDSGLRWQAILYRLSDYVRNGSAATPLADVDLPDVPADDARESTDTPEPPSLTFQGFTTRADKLYLLHGTTALADRDMNTVVTMLGWHSGEIERVPANSVFRVSEGFSHRQPQGIAVLRNGTASKLCVGFASRRMTDGEPRVANFAYMAP